MKTNLIITLFLVVLLGCSKEDNTPVPAVDLVGKWELVKFTVDPSPVNGTNDYLAYLRQLFSYNCTEINFYYNFSADKAFSESTESKCQSGTTNDTLLDGKWESTPTELSITLDDGTGVQQTQTYKIDLHPAQPGKYAYMDLTMSNNGTNYSLSLNKL
ncbi:lipocalin family protein [Spirosoma agri]|uniref:Lipocalin-like domain-containing protein n=1 Tax=Spirosoma agri TaxID=1987381 RepID=A0A6M0IFU9_9BACT|nr:lipocalin family protein [Spirosoma agri]NEU67156.1 hypothetical protein [Spirosoma agri]